MSADNPDRGSAVHHGDRESERHPTGREGAAVAALWSRWEQQLAKRAPNLLSELRPPAGVEAVRAAGARLGLTLPADLGASLAVHDGGGSANGLIGDWDLMDLDSMVDQTELMRQMAADGLFDTRAGDLHDAIDPTWWNDGWVPFACSGSGHFFCVDLAPAPGDTSGQVILFLHDDDERFLVADSYERWVAAIVSDLERGLYEYDEGSWNHHAFMKSSQEGRDIYD